MSAWGASFGSAWGNSFGSSPASGHAAAPGSGAGAFHYPLEVLERYDVPEKVAEAIVEVAKQQVEAKPSAVDQTAQLLAALEALGIEWQRRYDEALTAYVEALIQQQVAQAVEAARREDEYWGAAVTLLLLQHAH